MESAAWESYASKIVFGLIGLMLAACSTEVGNTVRISDQKIARYEALTPVQAAAELEKRIMASRRQGMPFLAPNSFNQGFEILVYVKQVLLTMPQSRVAEDIVRADAILDKGETRMSVVRTRLANELALKAQMDKDRVARIYAEEYQQVVDDLSRLIEKVEMDEAGSVDDARLALAKRMVTLDVQTIQHYALHQSDLMNQATRNMDGEKLAAKTLADAYRIYKEAEQRIADKAHDIVSVQRASADAMFAARHARFVVQRVAALQLKLRESAELVALEEEGMLMKISEAMGLKDLRDQPVEKQAIDIASAVADVVHGKQQSEQDAASALSQSLETRLREVNEVLAQNNERLAEKDVMLSEKEMQLFEKTALLTERDALVTEKNAQIRNLGDQILQLQEQNEKLVALQSVKQAAKPKSPK